MIYVLMQRHSDNGGTWRIEDLAVGWYDVCKTIVAMYPVDAAHPENQVKFVKRLVKDYGKRRLNYVLITNSLTIVYALNNELLRNPKLKVMAYEVVEGKRVKCIKKRWIDEGVLGHVSDELNTEMNRLLAKKFAPKKRKKS